MWLSLTLLIIVFYLLAKIVQKFVNWNDDYWPKLGVPRVVLSDNENVSSWKIFWGQKSLDDRDRLYYTKYENEPFIGYMDVRSPVLMVRDPELVQKILVTDFPHFVNRRSAGCLSNGFVHNSLFHLSGTEWLKMRICMNPHFSGGNVRGMFQHLKKSGENLVDFVTTQKNMNLGSPGGGDPISFTGGSKSNEFDVEIYEFSGRYTMDVISKTIFGTDSHHCLKQATDGDPIFMKMARQIQQMTLVDWIKFIFSIFLPNFTKLLKLSLLHPDAGQFFKKIIKKSIEQKRQKSQDSGGEAMRQNGGKIPSDFLQLLIMSTHEVSGSGQSAKENLNSFERNAQLSNFFGENFGQNGAMTDDKIVAQCLGIFLAGFDTTESVLSFTAYYLALFPKFQNTVRQEIDTVLTQGNENGVSYEKICKMEYLDMFVYEILRLHPPLTRVDRKVTKKYQIPGTAVVLDVGTKIVIPILPLQNDPKYFPNPKKFDPERFSCQNKGERHPYVWASFGHGPRGCLGMRFAMTAIKVAIVHLVKNFEILPCAQTFDPVRTEIVNGVLKPDRNVKILLKPIDGRNLCKKIRETEQHIE